MPRLHPLHLLAGWWLPVDGPHLHFEGGAGSLCAQHHGAPRMPRGACCLSIAKNGSCAAPFVLQPIDQDTNGTKQKLTKPQLSEFSSVTQPKIGETGSVLEIKQKDHFTQVSSFCFTFLLKKKRFENCQLSFFPHHSIHEPLWHREVLQFSGRLRLHSPPRGRRLRAPLGDRRWQGAAARGQGVLRRRSPTKRTLSDAFGGCNKSQQKSGDLLANGRSCCNNWHFFSFLVGFKMGCLAGVGRGRSAVCLACHWWHWWIWTHLWLQRRSEHHQKFVPRSLFSCPN